MESESGEKLSKNELKRRMKAEKKAAEKAQKAAEKVDTVTDKKQPAQVKDGLNDEEITPNEYYKLRSKAVEELKSDPATHPYPHKFHVSISITDFIAKYSSALEDGQSLDDVEVRVAGRIHAIRESGAKLLFYDLRGEGTKIKLWPMPKLSKQAKKLFLTKLLKSEEVILLGSLESQPKPRRVN